MSPSASPVPPALKIKLAGASPSFRLQSPSLNTVRLRRVFDLFDRNGDGEISTGELRGALCRLGLCTGDGTDAELSPLVAAHTRPGRAGLGFEEFEAFHRALGDAVFGAAPPTPASAAAAAEEADMKEAFGVFDEDGDGFISAKELQTVLGKLGFKEGESMEKVREMICSVDHNCDGRVDFGEFKHMMAGIAAQGS